MDFSRPETVALAVVELRAVGCWATAAVKWGVVRKRSTAIARCAVCQYL